MNKKRLVILSGPSGIGKGPLQAVVDRFYPELLKARPVLCNSRPARIGEIHGKHFYFLPEGLITSLANNPAFAVNRVRSDWQAIDLTQVERLLGEHELVFAEAYFTWGNVLKELVAGRGFSIVSVFLLPSAPPISESIAVEMMRGKLLRRGTESPQKIEERVMSLAAEIAHSGGYTHRLVNTAGEDDLEEWGEFGTREGRKGNRQIKSLASLGPRAKWIVETFVRVLRGQISPMSDGEYLKPNDN